MPNNEQKIQRERLKLHKLYSDCSMVRSVRYLPHMQYTQEETPSPIK